MVKLIHVSGVLALGLSATQATAARIRPRQAEATSTPSTGGSVTHTTTNQASKTTQDVPLALLSIANSLISENYPGQTISNVGTLSWPTTVIIGTHTYTVSPKVTAHESSTDRTKNSVAAQSTGPTAPKETGDKVSNNQKGDKRLAIIIGVVLGVVALAVMGLVFFCLHRRKNDNGSFFLRRTTPSMRSTGSWRSGPLRPDTMGTTTYISAGGHDPYQQKHPQTSVIQRGNTPPISAHPAYVQQESSRSTSDDNPFYTPLEYSATDLNSHELDSHQVQQVDYAEIANRRSSSSAHESRPPTPFSPLMMMQMPGPAARPHIHQNPFASPEDAEADDVVSPIAPPSRNPERRYSPMVHYPSWDEVSAFSFSGDERDGRPSDGGDGWRPERERRDGRHELA